jgi:hypothetical protein
MVRGKNSDLPNGKVINSQAGMDKAVKSICDILRRDKAKGALLPVGVLSSDRLRTVSKVEPHQRGKPLSLLFPLSSSLERGKQGGEVECSKLSTLCSKLLYDKSRNR